MKTKDLHINPSNPRKINKAKLDNLKASVKDFPKMMKLRPIIYDPETMNVLGGNMRLQALIELGYKEIPDEWVRSADELTEEEKKRFIIADNVGFGEWDFELLESDWDKDLLTEWGLEKEEGYFQKQHEQKENFDFSKLPYPITIVVDEDDYIKWQKIKRNLNENNDLKVFMDILKKIEL